MASLIVDRHQSDVKLHLKCVTAILPGAENLRGGGQEAEDRLQRLCRPQAQRHQGQHRLEGRQVLLPDQVTSQASFTFCFDDDISRPNVSILRSLDLNIQPGEKVSIITFSNAKLTNIFSV